MYKKLLLLTILCLSTTVLYAQEVTATPEVADEADDGIEVLLENPDEAGAVMPNVGILEQVPIVDVVEGVGTVLYANIAFREGASTSEKIIRYSKRYEKVLIIGESGDWVKVRMYNNAEAYISKKYVRTEKIFRDERTTTYSMDKKASYEINDILNRFNEAVKKSNYAEKYKIMPSLQIVDARKYRKKVTLTLFYSCIDIDGNMVPSYKDNDLSEEMRNLVELVFARLLLTKNDAFKVVIKVPSFNDEGTVVSRNNIYADIELEVINIDMGEVNRDINKLWDYTTAIADMPIDDLFTKYP